MKLLEGKVALITGGSRGIGAAIVKRFGEHGANVAFTYLSSAERANQVAEEAAASGVTVKAYKSDASSFDQAADLIKAVNGDFGKIDIIINNAGAGNGTNIKDFFDKPPDLEYAKIMFATNTIAPMKLTKKLIPLMSDKCRVVNVSSTIAGLKNYPMNTE